MMEAEIKELIDQLLKIEGSGLQLDFYRQQQILLQLFKSADALKWGWDVPDLAIGGIVLSLVFNKGKLNNNENQARFAGIKDSLNFIRLDLGQPHMYFKYYPQIMDAREVSKEIVYILQYVYDARTDQIDMYLDRYG